MNEHHQGKLWIVMEYMQGGCLTDVLGVGIKWPEAHIAYVCKQSLMGLAFLHRQHRMHRDIKSDNILVDTNGSVKLADFGFAVSLTEEQAWRKSVVGTPYWMAPELIRGLGKSINQLMRSSSSQLCVGIRSAACYGCGPVFSILYAIRPLLPLLLLTHTRQK